MKLSTLGILLSTRSGDAATNCKSTTRLVYDDDGRAREFAADQNTLHGARELVVRAYWYIGNDNLNVFCGDQFCAFAEPIQRITAGSTHVAFFPALVALMALHRGWSLLDQRTRRHSR